MSNGPDHCHPDLNTALLKAENDRLRKKLAKAEARLEWIFEKLSNADSVMFEENIRAAIDEAMKGGA